MRFILYSNNKIEENANVELLSNNPNAIAYISLVKDHIFSNKRPLTNLSKDIEIIDNEIMFCTIPYIRNNTKHKIEAILEKDKLLLYIKDKEFISFLKERLPLEKSVSAKVVLLCIFQYITIGYSERLIKLDEKLETVFEEAVVKDDIQMEKILKNKKNVSIVKRYINYYKSVLNYLDSTFEELPLYKNLYLTFDNALQMVEDVETSIYSCIEIYNSIYSNKMNKTMQVLTIITVIALPITTISGIFGMNFSNMPLINSPSGFNISVVIAVVVILFEIYFFKKKKFL